MILFVQRSMPPAERFGTTILFEYSRDVLTLIPEDKEVTFIEEFGRLNLNLKFTLKDMMYRGALAV